MKKLDCNFQFSNLEKGQGTERSIQNADGVFLWKWFMVFSNNEAKDLSFTENDFTENLSIFLTHM